MTEITHRNIDGRMVQIVSPQRLREVLDRDGDSYDRPSDFGPDDEWKVDGRGNHPNRPKLGMSSWTCDGPTVEAVCDILGWDASIHPIDVRDTRSGVEVRGTALHPNEWLALALCTGKLLPDGRQIAVVDVPRDVRLQDNVLIHRKGRFIVRRADAA